MLPSKKREILPWSAEGLSCVSLKSDVQPPAVHTLVAVPPFSALVAFVSPVSSKKNSRKLLPGRKTPFSGRLKGVPLFAFAAVFALNGALPWTAVSWIVTHRVSNDLPNVRSATWSGAQSAVCEAWVIGAPAALKTCRTWSFPLCRSPGRLGT